MGIALRVGALDVDDGDVRSQGADRQQIGAAKGIADRTDARMASHDIAADPGEGRQVGETHGGCLEGQTYGEVGMVFHHDAPRLALFVGTAESIS